MAALRIPLQVNDCVSTNRQLTAPFEFTLQPQPPKLLVAGQGSRHGHRGGWGVGGGLHKGSVNPEFQCNAGLLQRGRGGSRIFAVFGKIHFHEHFNYKWGVKMLLTTCHMGGKNTQEILVYA